MKYLLALFIIIGCAKPKYLIEGEKNEVANAKYLKKICEDKKYDSLSVELDSISSEYFAEIKSKEFLIKIDRSDFIIATQHEIICNAHYQEYKKIILDVNEMWTTNKKIEIEYSGEISEIISSIAEKGNLVIFNTENQKFVRKIKFRHFYEGDSEAGSGGTIITDENGNTILTFNLFMVLNEKTRKNIG